MRLPEHYRLYILTVLWSWTVSAQTPLRITPPKVALGFDIGDDYNLANYSQLETYWKKLAAESDRMRLVDIGPTTEGRHQYMAIITSPENLRNLDQFQDISRRLALADGLTEDQAHALAQEGKAVVWIDGGLHANETVGSQQLMEMVYQMVSRTDPETMRFLNDVISLYVPTNPDGQEFVANWYMREKDPLKRSLNGLPRLYTKYAGHDDNRDFYISNLPETTNMNQQLFREWFPQIVYDHHQTGPAGAVVFIPPFRDPVNYNLDPLVPLGVELVGAALHSRLVAEGKGGSAMRAGATYSEWWNGGLRTATYFHNKIGMLTEIIGNPTPVEVPLIADKQLPRGDWPLPVAPQPWRFRQSIEYEITNNRALLDLASRYRETFLYNIYRMGRNSIERGSKDTWTVTPKRIAALDAAAGTSAGPIPRELYNTVLHDPRARDPRGYILPSDQPDFPTAAEFVNALLKNGITVLRATSAFQVAGQTYPSGSYVVKTAQAFRPHVMDMFEPQDYPNDFPYPGGPPTPPYDIAGWTLALQMGVQFDRIREAFDGPFAKLTGLVAAPEGSITGPSNPAGYLISHRINNSFKLVNRLLKANCEVYWLKRRESADGQDLGTGAIWSPACPAAGSALERGARDLGVAVHGVAKAPGGEALKLKPVRIGLYDQYGGSPSSGWTRWVLEQYEFPFELVYPRTLDAGNLKSKFDVLVFADGALRRGAGGHVSGGTLTLPDILSIPTEFRGWWGEISQDKTLPQIKRFVDAGGSVVAIGSSTSVADLFGLPVKDALVDKDPNGVERPLPREKFYVPGSLLKARIDNSNPLAYGMPDQVDVFFDDSPAFRLDASADLKRISRVGWFAGPEVLDSGWAWGQQYLDGTTALAEASMGRAKVILLGPEVVFRGQPHATFKLLFNGLYYGNAQAVR
jgi:hypothetical protein